MWEQKSNLLIEFTGFIKLGDMMNISAGDYIMESQEAKKWQNKVHLARIIWDKFYKKSTLR